MASQDVVRGGDRVTYSDCALSRNATASQVA